MALKLVTMNQNYQFVKVYKRGKNLVHPLLVTYVCKNKGNKGTFRIGITTSKKIGKAHDRNRARRLIKEAVRQLAPQIRPPFRRSNALAQLRAAFWLSTAFCGAILFVKQGTIRYLKKKKKSEKNRRVRRIINEFYLYDLWVSAWLDHVALL